MTALRAELSAAKGELESERLINKKISKELSTSQSEEQRTAALVADLTTQVKEQKDLADKEMRRITMASDEEVAMLRAALKNLSDRLENPLVTVHPAENALLKRLNKPVTKPVGVTSPVAVPAAATILRGFDSDSTSTISSSTTSSATTCDEIVIDKTIKVASASAVATFERNLVTLRSKLRQGIKVHLWEEGPNSHVHSFECLLTLDRTYESLVFTAAANRRGTFSIFAQKVEVEPIRIKEIDDCSQGAAPMVDLSLMSVLGLSGQVGSLEENAMDTLTIKVGAKGVDEESARVVSLKLLNREARDFLLSAMRTMISDLHVSRGKVGSMSPVPKKAKPLSLCVPVSPTRPREVNTEAMMPTFPLPFLFSPHRTLPCRSFSFLAVPSLFFPHRTVLCPAFLLLSLPNFVSSYLREPCLAIPLLSSLYLTSSFLTVPYLALTHLFFTHLTLPRLTFSFPPLPCLSFLLLLI